MAKRLEVLGDELATAISTTNRVKKTRSSDEAVAVDSTRTIDIDQFVPREEIDDLYNIRPYFIAPEGKVGADAFVTIREAIADTGKVALALFLLCSSMPEVRPRASPLGRSTSS